MPTLTQCITHLAPVPVIMPALFISCDPSVYIIKSSGFKDCRHALNFVFALFLFPVPPVAFKHFSRLRKRCSSYGSEPSIGSEYSTSFAHFWASLSIRDEAAFVYACFVFKRKGWRASNLCSRRAACLQRYSRV